MILLRILMPVVLIAGAFAIAVLVGGLDLNALGVSIGGGLEDYIGAD